MNEPERFQARYKNFRVSGIGRTVPMLAIYGVAIAAFLATVVVLGGSQEPWTAIYFTLSIALFGGLSVYTVKREYDQDASRGAEGEEVGRG